MKRRCVGFCRAAILCILLPIKETDGMTTTTGNIFVNKTDSSNECNGMITVNSFPFRAGGDTTMAELRIPLIIVESTQAESLLCGQGTFSDYDVAAPALWYKIEGNDHYVKAVLETAENTERPFALFKGLNCGDELECILGHAAEHRDNMLTWFAKKETTYYFKVFGDPEGDDNIFVLEIMTSEAPRPSNDQCEFAQPLKLGDSLTGLTTGAWPHGIKDELCNLGKHSQALFYSIQGTGMDIDVTLRADVTEGLLGLAVVGEDDCSQCITHSEYMSATDSEQTVTFPSEEGKLYKIVVSGEEVFDAGLFHLAVGYGEVSRGVKQFQSLPWIGSAALLFSTLYMFG
ncbi:unnamed protein product [Cylindrotheca closterium]|uniref:Uncharacterized protein n=1 Tax=Cylindrotheca closterium TaxID=2856 RepID=A0AAD2FMX7_9STRA|nr:unnamed protein product [Cylindrotheca closterium]